MIKLLTFSIEKLLSLLRDACHKEASNWTERKLYPETDDLVTSIERDEIVAYLLEVCQREDMSFSIDTFSLFVILLDRFLSSYKVKSKYLECLAVACLYIASKVKEEDENISITSEFLMDCDAKCSIAELLRMEQMILTKFEWNVNQTTHVDFLNIFYAILVNKYKEIEGKLNNELTTKKVNIWKYKHAKSFKLDTSSSIDLSKVNKSLPNSSYPPVDLDFLDTLHSNLKQLLCIDELTSSFRPHMLVYCLISNHIEKTIIENQHINMIYKEALIQTLNSAKIYSKLIDEDMLDICKEKIKYHLSSIETSNSLFDQYLSEYHSGIVNSFRSSLSVVNTDLPAIKEEDEEIEQDNCVTSKNNNNNMILRNISNCMQNDTNEMDTSSSSLSSSSSFENNVNNNNDINNNSNDMIDKDDIDNGLNRFDQYKKKIMMLTHHQNAKGLTYADILIGRTRTDGTCICEQQKRKLSENSSVCDDDEIKQYYNQEEEEDYDEDYYENGQDDNDFDYASNEVRFN
jgi:hypothetical protein